MRKGRNFNNSFEWIPSWTKGKSPFTEQEDEEKMRENLMEGEFVIFQHLISFAVCSVSGSFHLICQVMNNVL